MGLTTRMHLIGQTFGMLNVISECSEKGSGSSFVCQCLCGSEVIVKGAYLTSGRTHCCGCTKLGKHGHARDGRITPEYRTWDGLKQRCLNPNQIGYRHYGGRGIKVCDRWLGKHGFENFLLDMGTKPYPRASLDRINNDGDYEPSNCRWTTRSVQNANRRSTKAIQSFSDGELIAELQRRNFLTTKVGAN